MSTKTITAALSFALLVSAAAVVVAEQKGSAKAQAQASEQHTNGVLVSTGTAVRQKKPYVDRSGDVLWNGGGGWEASNWTRMDVNRNGVISRNEWRGTTFQFNRLDRNDDGVIAASETW